MNIPQFTQDLNARGIQLWREGEQLRFRAPSGSLTDELLEKIKLHKAGILAFLARKDQEFPLSYGQQRLFVQHQLLPESSAYHFEFAFRICSAVNVDALIGACQRLVERHASLRSTFHYSGGEYKQVIQENQQINVRQVNAAGWTPKELDDQIVEASQQPFNLELGPLFRVHLFTRSKVDHVLLVTAHHIVYDGWSSWLCQSELQQLYLSEINGKSSALPPVNRGYADFVRLQFSMLSGSEGGKLWSYWRDQLSGDLPVLELATDRKRTAEISEVGASVRINLERALSSKLRELSQHRGVTLYTTLATVFKVLMHRYTGQEDLLIGSPLAGRNRAEFSGVVGCFVNPVVLRSTISATQSFSDYLEVVRDVVLGALQHQEYPYSQVIENLESETGRIAAPLFQVSFTLHQPQYSALNVSAARADGLAVKPYEVVRHDSQFELSLEMTDINNEIFGVFKYRKSLFDDATIRRLARHYIHLLEGIASNPTERISDLPMLGDDEQNQQVDWSAGLRCDWGEQSVHGLVEQQVKKTPDAPAVVFDNQVLTYEDLNLRANNLARRVLSQSLGEQVLVGIYLDRSPSIVVSMFGILKAGCAYLPMDTAYPDTRLTFMAEHASLKCVITTRDKERQIHSIAPEAKLIFLDELSITGEPPVSVEVGADDLAYVIYTSGSTGEPKGVMVEHGAVANFLQSMQQEPGMRAGDVLLATTTISFDISVLELFLPLTVGAKVVMARQEQVRDGHALVELMHEHRVTVMQATPTGWQMMLAQAGKAIPRIKILCGGEALTSGLAERLLKVGASVWNLYGPTEATVWCSVSQLERVGDHQNETGIQETIGFPISNTRFHVVDKNWNRVPVGVPGELCISGQAIARGYLGRQDLTAEKFVEDTPLGEVRLYRTGDLVRYRSDGRLEFLGRSDQQMKVRGYRIEPGEIISRLLRHSAVSECAVRRNDEAQLVAYIVPSSPVAEINQYELSAVLSKDLSQHLPGYMVPSALVFLSALPTTASGKVDLSALPAPEFVSDTPVAHDPPGTALETYLVDLWKDVLGVEELGINDSFYVLGGDSVKGVHLVNRLNEELDDTVYVVEIFDAPTIAEFAVALETNHPVTVEKRFGGVKAGQTGRLPEQDLSASRISEFRHYLDELWQRIDGENMISPASGKTVKSPVFVLSPPRSGSTLLRVLLAGHSELFAPPELELLSFGSLSNRKEYLTGRLSFRMEGVYRAIMELRRCDLAEAKRIMDEFEMQEFSTQALYAQLQHWCGSRKLVDKTPTYAMSPRILGRAEEFFERPRYIHLHRNPSGMVRSFENTQIGNVFFDIKTAYTERQLGELLWLVSHENILSFLDGIPGERKYSVAFEDLVKTPEKVLEGLSDFLGVEYQADMLSLYTESDGRMVDGVTPLSKTGGDGNLFRKHGKIDPAVADSWQQDDQRHHLSDNTRVLATQLGYKDF